MNFIKKNGIGILLCLAIAIPSWFLGKYFQWWEALLLQL